MLATVTYKTQMTNYTDIMALQCNDCDEKNNVKMQRIAQAW